MGCIGSKPSTKKDKDLETSLTGNEKPTKELSLWKQLSQKKEATLTKEPSLAKQPSLGKKEPSLRKKSSQGELKSERSKDEKSVPASSHPSVDKEVEVAKDDVNIIINENFEWDAQDTRTTSEKERELPRTPTPSPSPSLRKSPAFQMRGRRLSEGNFDINLLLLKKGRHKKVMLSTIF